MFVLSDQQLSFFETFGFLSFPGLLSDCAQEIIDTFESVWRGHGGGHAGRDHDGTRRSCIVPFIDQHERLCALLDDERIHGILTGILGDDFNYVGSDGNYYAGDTAWHSDGWGKAVRFVKVAFYLDEVTRTTGCLRVIPGSHHLQDVFANTLQTAVRQSQDKWGVNGSEVPALALETRPGDVVLFNHDLKHASFGGGTRRRMFTINCSGRFPEDEEHITMLKNYISAHARFWIDRVYGEKMTTTAGPQRMRHLEQVCAHDGHLAELAAKARLEMPEPSRG
ncbi:MAG: phytanoyl-CoA dioxygenase family protein [bacterium]|nr:phytanoyl-CoA dioxygenase family protein [bacterium]